MFFLPVVFLGLFQLGGGFKYLLFSSLFEEDEPILTNMFQRGCNHQPVNRSSKDYPPEKQQGWMENHGF